MRPSHSLLNSVVLKDVLLSTFSPTALLVVVRSDALSSFDIIASCLVPCQHLFGAFDAFLRLVFAVDGDLSFGQRLGCGRGACDGAFEALHIPGQTVSLCCLREMHIGENIHISLTTTVRDPKPRAGTASFRARGQVRYIVGSQPFPRCMVASSENYEILHGDVFKVGMVTDRECSATCGTLVPRMHSTILLQTHGWRTISTPAVPVFRMLLAVGPVGGLLTFVGERGMGAVVGKLNRDLAVCWQLEELSALGRSLVAATVVLEPPVCSGQVVQGVHSEVGVWIIL
jgi:hypothetical protein